MDDAQLVDAARAGDRNAIAAIYDRFADGIHDFCLSILRNRAEAADALQETFVVAFAGLDTLAEPARLRAWLYALAHRSLLDRIEHYGASFFSDEGELRYRGPSDERLSRAELAEFVWEMAGGLDLADRVLLDLHLRQGLEGRDLAGASGIPGAQLEGRLSRLEAQVDRSLGALVVARTGRRHCPEMYGILDRPAARLTPELRAAITAHVDECERCNPRRRIAPSALELLAAAPVAAAPPYLRSVALGKAEMTGVERESAGGRESLLVRLGWAFQRDGFPVLAARAAGAAGGVAGAAGGVAGAAGARRPAGWTGAIAPPTGIVGHRITDPRGTPTTYLPGIARRTALPPTSVSPGAVPPPVVSPVVVATERPRDRLGMLIGALAGVIVLVVAAVVLLRPGKSPAPVAVIATTTVSPATTSTVFTPTTIFTLPTTTVPPTTVVVNGHLVVAAKSLDLGVTATTISMQFGNDGGAAINFNALATGTGLTVNPIAGTLPPGATQTLTVTLDRTPSAPGPYTGSVQVTSSAGTFTLPVTATVDPGPTISNLAETPKILSPSGCLVRPTTTRVFTATVTADVSATQPLKVVVLHSRLSPSLVESAPIPMSMSGTVYAATLGPYTAPGTVDWWITAIDTAGATGTSSHGNLVVSC